MLRDKPGDFARTFATTILHEVTHIRDYIRTEDVVDPHKREQDPAHAFPDLVDYVNSPHEVRARMSQTVYEVLAFARHPAGKLQRRRAELMRDNPNEWLVDEALRHSKTWQGNETLLDQENREKILRAVYRALERDGFLVERDVPRLPRTRRSVAAEVVNDDNEVDPEQLAALPDGEIERLPIEVLDKAAFGFNRRDVLDIPVQDIEIQYTGDYDEALGQLQADRRKVRRYLRIAQREPIEVTYKHGVFYLEDGHHRYVATKMSGEKTIRAVVDIKDNPIVALRRKYGYPTTWYGRGVEEAT